MRFPYHQIEEDSIEPGGNIQSGATQTDNEILEDETFSPSKPLLPFWPFWSGWIQILVGFMCAIFGVVNVFIIPAVNSVDADFGLYKYNCYGASIWSGLLLVISGSCAVRASKKRDLFSVIQFYVVTGYSLLFCLSLLNLILWCCSEIIDSSKIDVKYLVISIVSAVWCILGCLSLILSAKNYFFHVMMGEVHLLKKLGVCWLPCIFYTPPKEVLETYKQEQSVKAKI